MGLASIGRRYEQMDRTLLGLKLWPRYTVVLLVISLMVYTIFTHVSNMTTFTIPIQYKKEGSECNVEEEFSNEGVEIDEERLFYNRVPKSASTTLYSVMKKLAAANNYQHYNSKIYDQKTMDLEEQDRFVRNVTNTPTPCSFDRHVFFVDFSRFGAKSPVYINLVREPVERIVSSYYYRRSVARKRITDRPNIGEWLNKSFRHCIKNGHEECSYLKGRKYRTMLLPYFCGQDERCQVLNDPWALRKAKHNIDQYYAVVGIVEELTMTIKVLEATLPRFFKGAMKVYRAAEGRRNENPEKKDVDEDLKAALKANLTAEYDLYYYLIQRLYRQYRDIMYH